MPENICPICGNEMYFREDHDGVGRGTWDCRVCDEAGEDEPVIISRQLVWFCPDCDEQNFTDLPFERATCAKCGKDYSAFLVGSLEGTYEQTMDSNGKAEFDAYIPEIPDINEPGFDHYDGYDDYGLG